MVLHTDHSDSKTLNDKVPVCWPPSRNNPHKWVPCPTELSGAGVISDDVQETRHSQTDGSDSEEEGEEDDDFWNEQLCKTMQTLSFGASIFRAI